MEIVPLKDEAPISESPTKVEVQEPPTEEKKVEAEIVPKPQEEDKEN